MIPARYILKCPECSYCIGAQDEFVNEQCPECAKKNKFVALVLNMQAHEKPEHPEKIS